MSFLNHDQDNEEVFQEQCKDNGSISSSVQIKLVGLFLFLFIFVSMIVLGLVMFGDWTHVSNNEEFDRVAQKLGFEVTHPEVWGGQRSVATLEGCTVTFEVSVNGLIASETYLDLGGSTFGEGNIAHSNTTSSSGDDEDEGGGKFKATKIENTVLVAQTSDNNTCQSQVDKLIELLGYDTVIRDDPMLDEIIRRFSMLAYE